MLVFFIGKDDISSRLGTVVTLFLALTAVQFVLVEQPRSSKVLTSQMIIVTYIFLAGIAETQRF